MVHFKQVFFPPIPKQLSDKSYKVFEQDFTVCQMLGNYSQLVKFQPTVYLHFFLKLETFGKIKISQNSAIKNGCQFKAED